MLKISFISCVHDFILKKHKNDMTLKNIMDAVSHIVFVLW